MKMEKCKTHEKDFTKRTNDTKENVALREKKIKDIDSKLQHELSLKNRVETQIAQLEKQLRTYQDRCDDLQTQKSREEKFLRNVRHIQTEVQEEIRQIRAEQATLRRTSAFHKEKLQKVHNQLKKLVENVEGRMGRWR